MHLALLLPSPPPQVNASDARGKSDASALKGVGGKLANAIKEMSTNTAVSYDRQGHRKKVGGSCWEGGRASLWPGGPSGGRSTSCTRPPGPQQGGGQVAWARWLLARFLPALGG